MDFLHYENTLKIHWEYIDILFSFYRKKLKKLNTLIIHTNTLKIHVLPKKRPMYFQCIDKKVKFKRLNTLKIHWKYIENVYKNILIIHW